MMFFLCIFCTFCFLVQSVVVDLTEIDKIEDNQYGERYNIGNNQYSSKHLSYCPIYRFEQDSWNRLHPLHAPYMCCQTCVCRHSCVPWSVHLLGLPRAWFSELLMHGVSLSWCTAYCADTWWICRGGTKPIIWISLLAAQCHRDGIPRSPAQLITLPLPSRELPGPSRELPEPPESFLNLPGSFLNLLGSFLNFPGSFLNLPGSSWTLWEASWTFSCQQDSDNGDAISGIIHCLNCESPSQTLTNVLRTIEWIPRVTPLKPNHASPLVTTPPRSTTSNRPSRE
jgi:hypothetical protein